jgi:hypothetical protein
MFDIEWILIIIWFVSLILAFGFRELFFKGFAGIVGILTGFVIMANTAITESMLSLALGLTFIIASLYLFYDILLKQVEGKETK